LFNLDVGVLRWAERVNFFFSGAFATGRYPPSSLQDSADYPAHLEVAYPEDLNRWLVLVKWLLAIPRLIIVGILVGGSSAGSAQHDDWVFRSSGGLIGILELVAVVILAFSGKYPRGLFDLPVGVNRWVCRVWAYTRLMTDQSPRSGWTAQATIGRPHRIRRQRRKTDVDLAAAWASPSLSGKPPDPDWHLVAAPFIQGG
jgi:hypothetical protein